MPYIVANLALSIPRDGAGLEQVDLNQMVTGGRDTCLLIKCNGVSQNELTMNIGDGDWIVVDKEEPPTTEDTVLIYEHGGYELKRYEAHDGRGRRGLFLVPNLGGRPPDRSDDYELVGVVTWVGKPRKRRKAV